MSEKKVNVPLLRKAVEWVEEQASKPEGGNWYQGSWVQYLANLSEYDRTWLWENYHVDPHCGTAYCMAGYIGQLYDDAYKTSDYNSDGEHVSGFAREALGINHGQADQLFAGNNTAERIRQLAEEIAGEKL
jgi:hypothetical protein